MLREGRITLFIFSVAIVTSMFLLFGFTFDVRCLGLKTSNVGGCHGDQGTFFHILVNDPELQGFGGTAQEGIDQTCVGSDGARGMSVTLRKARKP